MSIDRLTLALLWPTHIIIDSYLKARRLEYYIGEPYRNYETRVPGCPFLRGSPGRFKPVMHVAMAFPIETGLETARVRTLASKVSLKESPITCKTAAA